MPAAAGYELLEPLEPELMMLGERETGSGPIKGLKKPSESIPLWSVLLVNFGLRRQNCTGSIRCEFQLLKSPRSPIKPLISRFRRSLNCL